MLAKLFLAAKNDDEILEFLRAILTPAEFQKIAERVEIVAEILSGKSHREISKKVGASLATIGRGSREVQFGSGILQKLFSKINEN